MKKYTIRIKDNGFEYTPRSLDEAKKTVERYVLRHFPSAPEIIYNYDGEDYIEVMLHYTGVVGDVFLASMQVAD